MLQPPSYLLPQHLNPQIIYSGKKLQHINQVFPSNETHAALYIGDTIATLKTEYLVDNQIEAVLCCNSQAAKNVHMTKVPFDFKYIEITDHLHYPIKLHFDSACQWIEEKLTSGKNLLIQCHGGVSRSATIVLAYLIKSKKWSLKKAYSYLKQKRPRIKPNQGFWRQLGEYEEECNNVTKDETDISTPPKNKIEEIQTSLSGSDLQKSDLKTADKSSSNIKSDQIFDSKISEKKIQDSSIEKRLFKTMNPEVDRNRSASKLVQYQYNNHLTMNPIATQGHLKMHRTPQHRNLIQTRTLVQPPVMRANHVQYAPGTVVYNQGHPYIQHHYQLYNQHPQQPLYYSNVGGYGWSNGRI